MLFQDHCNLTDSKLAYILSPKATIKRIQKLNRVRHRVCHADPWPDPTQPRSWPGDLWPEDPVPTLFRSTSGRW